MSAAAHHIPRAMQAPLVCIVIVAIASLAAVCVTALDHANPCMCVECPDVRMREMEQGSDSDRYLMVAPMGVE